MSTTICKFNGEGIEDFMRFEENFHVEAGRRGCDHHFVWKIEDVKADKTVPEEEFLGVRPCPPGQEEAYCLERKQFHVDQLTEKLEAQMEMLAEGFKGQELKQKEVGLRMKYQDDCSQLERAFDKTVADMRASCDLYERSKKLFLDLRGQAVALLTHWLGPNALNRIYKTLRDVGPKNAWKALVDIYNEEATSSMYLNTVTEKMGRLVFSKKFGTVADHMKHLDDLNAPLVRVGRPVDDLQLLSYLLNAIDRNKEAKQFYGEGASLILLQNLNRADAVLMLTRIELSHNSRVEASGERKSKVGAQYAKVSGFAGAASVVKSNGKKRKYEGGSKGERSGGVKVKKEETDSSSKATPFCTKCGGPHYRKNCEKEVYCSVHKCDTHSDGVCWDQHPELKPKFSKVGNRK